MSLDRFAHDLLVDSRQDGAESFWVAVGVEEFLAAFFEMSPDFCLLRYTRLVSHSVRDVLRHIGFAGHPFLHRALACAGKPGRPGRRAIRKRVMDSGFELQIGELRHDKGPYDCHIVEPLGVGFVNPPYAASGA